MSNAQYTELGSLLTQTLENWIRSGTNHQSNIKMFSHLFVPFYFIEVFIFPQTGDFVRYSLLGVGGGGGVSDIDFLVVFSSLSQDLVRQDGSSV